METKRKNNVHGRIRCVLLAALNAFVLAGCVNSIGHEGYVRDRAGDYTDAEATKPIKIPADKSSKQLTNVLVVPETRQSTQRLPRKFEVPRPSQRLKLKEGARYSLERSGSEEWLLIHLPPSEIWHGISKYIDSKGVGVITKNRAEWVIETDWQYSENKEEPGIMTKIFGGLFGSDYVGSVEDRFRFELRNENIEGYEATAVHVYHQGRSSPEEGEEPSAVVQWNNQGKRSYQLDKNVLAELLIFLAKLETTPTNSLKAQNLDVSTFAEMGRDGNSNPVITIRGLSYVRVWDSVSVALEETNLKVVDRDRSTGVFYLVSSDVTSAKDRKTKSFWSRLFSSSDSKEDIAGKGKLTLRLSNYSEVVQISVEKDINTLVSEEVSKKILKEIYDNLN